MRVHVPVLLDEVLGLFRGACVDRSPGMITVVDATLGAGGHSAAMLAADMGCFLVAFDRDETAREMASKRLAEFSGRFEIVEDNFASISREVVSARSRGLPVGFILFDLGVSMMQLTTGERGFSYDEDGPLDMRMDTSRGETAADVLASSDVDELARIFREYGEERWAWRIANGIVDARDAGRLPTSTGGLVALIREILPAPVQRKMGGHPARRVFQALRIAVNGEIDAIDRALVGALDAADDGCVIAVISYHSLEDRLVKHRFKNWSIDGVGSLLNKKPTVPSETEIEQNRSARSAKLRAFKVHHKDRN